MNHPAITVVLTVAVSCAAWGSSGIDAESKYAWGENVGWTNWRDAYGNMGVQVNGRVLAGYVWAENAGWLHLGDGTPANGTSYANIAGADYGVNIDWGMGKLYGLAWGENIGWVNFGADPAASRAAIASDGSFSGYTWGENVGWINLGAGLAWQFVWGDVNRDGTAGAVDAAQILQWDAFVIGEFSGYPGLGFPGYPAAGNVNGDGVLGAVDAAQVLQYDAFILDCFPADTDCDAVGPED